MAKFTTIITILVLIMMSGSPAMAVDVQDLVYMTEEYRPHNYMENGELKGISVDLLKLMWEKMGCPAQPIRVLPWARAYQYVQNKANHVLFAMARTPERETTFKWVGPLHTSKLVLISLAIRPITLTRLDEAKKYKIGTIIEDVSEQLLISKGFRTENLQRVSEFRQNIAKLQSSRIDLISYSEEGLLDFVTANHLNAEDFKVAYILQEIGSYYAFNRETPDNIIQRFQTALDSLKPEHQKLLEKYRFIK